ncbi:MAG: cardiolipin synthase [Candidatus Methanomethylophilaceae archaeon]|jgi:cardiolipin synthase
MFGITIPGDYITGSFSGDIILFMIPINFVFILFTLFLERSNPKGTMLWILVMILFPPAGFILYLVFGQTFYPRYAFRSKAHGDDAFRKTVEKQWRTFEKDRPKLDAIHPNCSDFIDVLMNAGYIYTENNSVKVYSDGTDYFKDMIDDIRNAEDTINFEFYMMRDDEFGKQLIDLFTEKVNEGVEVRILCDAYGFGKGLKENIKRFVEAGGGFSLFHSLATCLLSPRKNNRNHRKIMVIDGKIGWIGGFNIGMEYVGDGPLGYWRDTGARIVGPAVLSMQIRFLTDWRYAVKEDITTEKRFYNPESDPGDIPVQIISGGPDMLANSPIRAQYLMMFSRCKKTLYIHTPYLIPDDATMAMLKISAISGVDVRIIIPDKPDHPFVYWVNLYYANQLMESGVRVYHYNNGFLHSKAIVADSFYCSIGSANVDERSMNLNFETNAMIYSKELGEMLTEAFLKDLEKSTEYSMEKYKNKKLRESVKVSICRLASCQL